MQFRSLFLILVSFSIVSCDWLDNDFPPGVQVNIQNPMFFGITEHCTISTPDASDVLNAVLLNGSATLNDNPVPVGQGLQVSVKNGDSLKITASAHASVNITNTGSSLVHSHCTLGKKERKILKKTYTYIAKVLGPNSEDIGAYDFAPNTPVDISNPLFFGISASCKVSTVDESDVIEGKMQKGSGTLDGQTITANTTLTVKNGDTFSITASAFAAVVIVNTGANNVHADCALTLDSLKNLYILKNYLERYFN